MLVVVHACNFHVKVHAEVSQFFYEEKERISDPEDPSEDQEHSCDLVAQNGAVTSREATILVAAVDVVHISGGRKETNGDDAPGPAESVHRDCVDRIIYLELEE